jgi:hypothetical protein
MRSSMRSAECRTHHALSVVTSAQCREVFPRICSGATLSSKEPSWRMEVADIHTCGENYKEIVHNRPWICEHKAPWVPWRFASPHLIGTNYSSSSLRSYGMNLSGLASRRFIIGALATQLAEYIGECRFAQTFVP